MNTFGLPYTFWGWVTFLPRVAWFVLTTPDPLKPYTKPPCCSLEKK